MDGPRKFLEASVIDVVTLGLAHILETTHKEGSHREPLKELEEYIRTHNPRASCPTRVVTIHGVPMTFRECKSARGIRKVDDANVPVYGGCVPSARGLLAFIQTLSETYTHATFVIAEDRELIFMEDTLDDPLRRPSKIPYVGLDIRTQAAAHEIRFKRTYHSTPELYVEDAEHDIADLIGQGSLPAGKAIHQMCSTQDKMSFTVVRTPVAELSCLSNSVTDDLLGTFDIYNAKPGTCVVVLGSEDRDRVAYLMTLSALHYTVRKHVDTRVAAMLALPEKIKLRNAARASVEKPHDDVMTKRGDRDKMRATKLREMLTSIKTMDEIDALQLAQEERESVRVERRRYEDEVRNNVESTEQGTAIIKLQSLYRAHLLRRTMGGEYIRVDVPRTSRDALLTKEHNSRLLRAGSYKLTARIMARLINVHGGQNFNTLMTRAVTNQRLKLKPVYRRLGPADNLDVSSEEEHWEEFLVEYIPGESHYDFAMNPQHVVNVAMDKCCLPGQGPREYVTGAFNNYKGVGAIQQRAAKLIERYGRMILTAGYLALHFKSLGPSMTTPQPQPPANKSVTPQTMTMDVPGSDTTNNFGVTPTTTSLSIDGPLSYTAWTTKHHEDVESWFDTLPLLMQVTLAGKVPKSSKQGPPCVMEQRVLLRHNVLVPPWSIRTNSGFGNLRSEPANNILKGPSRNLFMQKVHKKIPVYLVFDHLPTKTVEEMTTFVAQESTQTFERCKWISTSPEVVVMVGGEVYLAANRRQQFKAAGLIPIDSLLTAKISMMDRAGLEKANHDEKRKMEKATAGLEKASHDEKRKMEKAKKKLARGSEKIKKKESPRGKPGLSGTRWGLSKPRDSIHEYISIPGGKPGTDGESNDGEKALLGVDWSECERRAALEIGKEITDRDGMLAFFHTTNPTEEHIPVFTNFGEAETLFPEDRRIVKAKPPAAPTPVLNTSITSGSTSTSLSKRKSGQSEPPAKTTGGAKQPVPPSPALVPRPPSGNSAKSGARPTAAIEKTVSASKFNDKALTEPRMSIRSSMSQALSGTQGGSFVDAYPPTIDGLILAPEDAFRQATASSSTWTFQRCPIPEESGMAFFHAVDDLYAAVHITFTGDFAPDTASAVVVPLSPCVTSHNLTALHAAAGGSVPVVKFILGEPSRAHRRSRQRLSRTLLALRKNSLMLPTPMECHVFTPHHWKGISQLSSTWLTGPGKHKSRAGLKI